MFSHLKDILSFETAPGGVDDEEIRRTISLDRVPTTESQVASGCCSPFSRSSGKSPKNEIVQDDSDDELSFDAAPAPIPERTSVAVQTADDTPPAIAETTPRATVLSFANSRKNVGAVEQESSGVKDVEEGNKNMTEATPVAAAVPLPAQSHEEAPMELSHSSSLKLVDPGTDDTSDTDDDNEGDSFGKAAVSSGRNTSKKTWLLCIAALLLIAVAVAVPAAVLVPRNNDTSTNAASATTGDETTTGEDTEPPTASPTAEATLPEECEPSYDSLDVCVLTQFTEEEAATCIDCVWRLLPPNTGDCEALTTEVCNVIKTCECSLCEAELVEYLDCQSTCDLVCQLNGTAT